MLDILIASDILLMPSQHVGISIALLEAMAAVLYRLWPRLRQEEIVSQEAAC